MARSYDAAMVLCQRFYDDASATKQLYRRQFADNVHGASPGVALVPGCNRENGGWCTVLQ